MHTVNSVSGRQAGRQATTKLLRRRSKCRRRRLHEVYKHSCEFVSSNFVAIHFFSLPFYLLCLFSFDATKIIYSICVGVERDVRCICLSWPVYLLYCVVAGYYVDETEVLIDLNVRFCYHSPVADTHTSHHRLSLILFLCRCASVSPNLRLHSRRHRREIRYNFPSNRNVCIPFASRNKSK